MSLNRERRLRGERLKLRSSYETRRHEENRKWSGVYNMRIEKVRENVSQKTHSISNHCNVELLKHIIHFIQKCSTRHESTHFKPFFWLHTLVNRTEVQLMIFNTFSLFINLLTYFIFLKFGLQIYRKKFTLYQSPSPQMACFVWPTVEKIFTMQWYQTLESTKSLFLEPEDV